MNEKSLKQENNFLKEMIRTYYQPEIEELNSKVENLMTLYTTEREVKEDYKAIIKEVRDYIENNNIYSNKKIDDILEILDKGVENGNSK